ncbi:MAG: hypothetical protein IBX50_03190 [Marinospirillum sp.]|uniref:TorF family putative porin n=1 Tax=Marinospirillum sp. TaxID=2183934 RepID=UPI0019F6A5C1|nr:TorF family putative porin [Marinospirillum sp.]MBE0505709.1 hypothetical protein [Marinospirillum sp.]
MMKKTLIAASIAALSAGFVAAPAFAEVAGHVGATLAQPTNSDLDTMMTLEAGVEYSHESGAYAGLLFTTMDLLDSDSEFKQSEIELNLGYAGAINDAAGYDAGLTYTIPMDSDADAEYELYFGGNYSVNEALGVSAYFYLPEADDSIYLEFGADYALDAVDLFALLTLGVQDASEGDTALELGVGKEIMPQQYVTGAFALNLDDSDASYLEFTYTYSW